MDTDPRLSRSQAQIFARQGITLDRSTLYN
jgi:hypothetical protein